MEFEQHSAFVFKYSKILVMVCLHSEIIFKGYVWYICTKIFKKIDYCMPAWQKKCFEEYGASVWRYSKFLILCTQRIKFVFMVHAHQNKQKP